jgi:FkbM family methyltransferase
MDRGRQKTAGDVPLVPATSLRSDSPFHAAAGSLESLACAPNGVAMQTNEAIFFDLLKDMRTAYGADLFQDGIEMREGGIVLYGPYVTLPAGRWTVRVAGHAAEQGCQVDVAAGAGQMILGTSAWAGDLCTFEVDCLFPMENVEVRVHAEAGALVRIDSVSVERRFDPGKDRSFSVLERMGFSLLLDPTSWVDRCLIQQGSWEQEHLNYLTTAAYTYGKSARDMAFLDIGAYFGLYALVMSRTNLFSDIVAFEADALNFRQLCANLLLNDPFCRIESRFIAASDEPGEAVFEAAMHHPDGNRGGVGLKEKGTPMSAGRRHVATDTIDNLVGLRGRKLFAKIDVEGHEVKVLAGMRQLLSQNRMFLQIESFETLQELKALLEPLGYRIVHQIQDDYYFTNFEDSI